MPQEDPRLAVVAAKLPTSLNVEWAREILAAADAADDAAGIRRIAEDTAAADRVRAWCAFHRANYNGTPAEQLGVSYRAAPLLLADLESLVGGPLEIAKN